MKVWKMVKKMLAFQLGLGRLVVLQGVEVLQEEQPGRLLGVVQLAGAASVLVEDVVDVLEGLLKHCDADFLLLISILHIRDAIWQRRRADLLLSFGLRTTKPEWMS